MDGNLAMDTHSHTTKEQSEILGDLYYEIKKIEELALSFGILIESSKTANEYDVARYYDFARQLLELEKNIN